MMMMMNWGLLVTLTIYQTSSGKIRCTHFLHRIFQYKNISKRPPIFNEPIIIFFFFKINITDVILQKDMCKKPSTGFFFLHIHIVNVAHWNSKKKRNFKWSLS